MRARPGVGGGVERVLDQRLPELYFADPADVYRAGRSAVAANVGEAEGARVLAFEETGAYRLLPAMSEDPAELERFYSETVEPLVAYDEQYETELVGTVETSGERRERGRDRAAAVHPPPHDPLPARTGP